MRIPFLQEILHKKSTDFRLKIFDVPKSFCSEKNFAIFVLFLRKRFAKFRRMCYTLSAVKNSNQKTVGTEEKMPFRNIERG